MKKAVKDQMMSKRIARLGKNILKAYAVMALNDGGGDYFAPIDKLIDEISFVFANACICEIFDELGLYAFICAAHEHWNTSEMIRDDFVRPDKNVENLSAAVRELADVGWPCPGHTQFWAWVTELRRRPKYWDNGSENRSAFQLNSWEWIVSWDELDWSAGFDIIDRDEFDGRFVAGYLLNDDHTPVYLEYKEADKLWIAGRFGNKSWREKEFLSTNWRNPFAAAFAINREPMYPGANWYNGPGTETIEDQGASAP